MAIEIVVKEIVKEVGKVALKEIGARKILKYADLFNFSKSELLKAGFSEKQILSKLSKFYLKEGWQLVINESKGETLSRALRELKKGRLSQGVKIPKTALTEVKQDLSTLRKLSKTFGKDSLASKLIKEYENGEINNWQMHNALSTYVNSIKDYEPKAKLKGDIQLFIDNLQESGIQGYTRFDIIQKIEESKL